ncbi:MAG: hypothetical protein ACKVQK_15570 [Burkholderiales bacterium]
MKHHSKKMGQVSEKLIVQTVQDGIKRAASLYRTVSGGQNARQAPEYFFVSQIALQLHDKTKEKCYVILEKKVSEMLLEAGAKQIGRYKNKIRVNGRSDIVLLYKGKDKRPRALIEVKSPLTVVDKRRFAPDIERICHVLLRARAISYLHFGIFAFYYGKGQEHESKDSMRKNISEIVKPIKCLARKNGCWAKLTPGSHGIYSGDQSFAPVCLVIKRMRAKKMNK